MYQILKILMVLSVLLYDLHSVNGHRARVPHNEKVSINRARHLNRAKSASMMQMPLNEGHQEFAQRGRLGYHTSHKSAADVLRRGRQHGARGKRIASRGLGNTMKRRAPEDGLHANNAGRPWRDYNGALAVLKEPRARRRVGTRSLGRSERKRQIGGHHVRQKRYDQLGMLSEQGSSEDSYRLQDGSCHAMRGRRKVKKCPTLWEKEAAVALELNPSFNVDGVMEPHVRRRREC